VIAGFRRPAASGARSRSCRSATPTQARRGPKPRAKRFALAREIAALKGLTFGGSCCTRPRPAGPRRNVFTTRRWPASRIGLMRDGLYGRLAKSEKCRKLKGATEHRPAPISTMTGCRVAAGVATWGRLRTEHLFTVVSRAGADRGILDAGSEDADVGYRRRTRRAWADPRTSRSKNARFAESTAFSTSRRSIPGPMSAMSCGIVPNHVCVVVK